jgi:6-phosphogluconolactonase
MSGAHKPILQIVADDAVLAETAAASFVQAAHAAIGARGRFNVALAGGSTPKAAYALLAAEPLRARVDWQHVRFFFSDERCVGPDDEQSNYKMARDAMLAPLEIPETNVFRMRGEDEPAVAASAYADLVRRELGDVPTFDLIMLGMGPDGHTASLFPGTDPLEGDTLLVKAPWVAKFSTFRITFTPSLINAAREVHIATGGEAKADALAGVLEGPYQPSVYPIQIVSPTGSLVWMVDRAAAAKLTGAYAAR